MYFFLLCKIQDIFHLAQRLTNQYAFFLVKKHSMVYCLQTMLEMLSLFFAKSKKYIFFKERKHKYFYKCVDCGGS